MNKSDILIEGAIVKAAAQIDLREILVYLGENNPQRAVRFANALIQTLEQLVAMPHLGSPRENLSPRFRNVRQWPVKDFRSYLIFYQPFASSNGIEILRVLHTSRDAAAHLADDATPED